MDHKQHGHNALLYGDKSIVREEFFAVPCIANQALIPCVLFYQNGKEKGEETILLSNEQMVNRYFYLIDKKDVEGLLDLFTDDAVLYEQFSNVQEGLQGRSAIEYFLKVAVMANAGLQRTMEFTDNSADGLTASVTFERGDRIKGKFTFNFASSNTGKNQNALDKVQSTLDSRIGL